MKNTTLLPTTVNENEYLSLQVVSFIFQVGVRQTRSIANKENIEKAYYSSKVRCDLVCYRSIDVFRVAVGRRNIWPEPWPEQYRSDFIQKSETYGNAKNAMFNIHQQKNMHKEAPEEVEEEGSPAMVNAQLMIEFARFNDAQESAALTAKERLVMDKERLEIDRETLEMKKEDRRSNKNHRLLQSFAAVILFPILAYFFFEIHNRL